MKRQSIIFPALFLALTAMPFSVSALTASGTVSDEIEPLMRASIVAVDSTGTQNIKDSNGNLVSTTTDMDGNFKLEVPTGAKLKISYVGLAEKIIEPGENLNIKLESGKQTELKSVGVVGSKDLTGKECSAEVDQSIYADLTEEEKARYNPVLLNDPYAIKEKKGKYKKVGDKYICIPNECIQDYRLEGTACAKYQCSKEDLKTANATNGTWDKNLQTCIPVCDENNGFTRNIRNICERTKCAKFEIDNLKKQDKNIDTVELDKNGKCVPSTCIQDYKLKGNVCVKYKCSTDEEELIIKSGAKGAKWDEAQQKCIATECSDTKNFKLSDGKCTANDCPAKELEKLRASAGYMQDDKCIPIACITDYKLENGACTNADILAEKQKAYDEAKAKEQSFENRALTAATTAATGIGGMQLLQGMAEQSADEDAAADMAAYIETMRCTYADGKQVKAGPEEIELPGANNQELMNLRAEYLSLAQDLKERKNALGIKAGIESEVIIDRTETGLYDEENVGIAGGNYASVYRAQALKSETDQAKIDDAKNTSANRVKYGAIAAGAGVVGGILGNELINGKLGEKLKEKNQGKALRAAVEIEKDALEDMKKCLKDAGVKDTDGMEFQNFYISVLSVKNINCKREITKINGQTTSNIAAKTIFADSNNANEIYNQLITSFGPTIAGKMIGVTLTQTPTDPQKQNAINTLKSGIDKVTKRFQDAAKEDEKRLSSSGLKDFDIDFSSILSSFNGDDASSSIMDMVNNGFK